MWTVLGYKPDCRPVKPLGFPTFLHGKTPVFPTPFPTGSMNNKRTCGPYWDRTSDLFHAMEARYQLRQRPFIYLVYQDIGAITIY